MSDSNQPPQAGKPPAGFYPDESGAMRWWDGNGWTDHYQGGGQTTAVATMTRPKKKHTFRNVMLIILALIVLSFVGCVALIGGAANEVDKSIKASEAKDNEPGGPNNPLKISEGKGFKVAGFEYSDGWKVVDDGLGSVGIKGLKVTNNREKKDSALVEIKFMKGSEVLALADCSTEPVAIGQTTTLSCISTDETPKGYDKITINDTF